MNVDRLTACLEGLSERDESGYGARAENFEKCNADSGLSSHEQTNINEETMDTSTRYPSLCDGLVGDHGTAVNGHRSVGCLSRVILMPLSSDGVYRKYDREKWSIDERIEEENKAVSAARRFRGAEKEAVINANNQIITLVSVDTFDTHVQHKPDWTKVDMVHTLSTNILAKSMTLTVLDNGYNHYRDRISELNGRHVLVAYACKLPKHRQYRFYKRMTLVDGISDSVTFKDDFPGDKKDAVYDTRVLEINRTFQYIKQYFNLFSILTDFVYEISLFKNGRGLLNVIVVNKYWLFKKGRNAYVPHYALLKNDLYTDYVINAMVKMYDFSIIRFISTEHTTLYTNSHNLKATFEIELNRIIPVDNNRSTVSGRGFGNNFRRTVDSIACNNVEEEADVSRRSTDDRVNSIYDSNSYVDKSKETGCKGIVGHKVAAAVDSADTYLNVPFKKRKPDSITDRNSLDGDTRERSSSIASTNSYDSGSGGGDGIGESGSELGTFEPTLIMFRRNFDLYSKTLTCPISVEINL